MLYFHYISNYFVVKEDKCVIIVKADSLTKPTNKKNISEVTAINKDI